MQRFLGALGAIVATVAACGGDDSPASGDPSMLIVNASDFEFELDRFEVEAGRDITVQLRNRGAIEHTWTVLDAGVQVATAEDIVETDILWSVRADAAQSENLVTVSPPAGTYQVICTMPGHLEAGMEATLVSTGAGSALASGF